MSSGMTNIMNELCLNTTAGPTTSSRVNYIPKNCTNSSTTSTPTSSTPGGLIWGGIGEGYTTPPVSHHCVFTSPTGRCSVGNFQAVKLPQKSSFFNLCLLIKIAKIVHLCNRLIKLFMDESDECVT